MNRFDKGTNERKSPERGRWIGSTAVTSVSPGPFVTSLHQIYSSNLFTNLWHQPPSRIPSPILGYRMCLSPHRPKIPSMFPQKHKFQISSPPLLFYYINQHSFSVAFSYFFAHILNKLFKKAQDRLSSCSNPWYKSSGVLAFAPSAEILAEWNCREGELINASILDCLVAAPPEPPNIHTSSASDETKVKVGEEGARTTSFSLRHFSRSGAENLTFILNAESLSPRWDIDDDWVHDHISLLIIWCIRFFWWLTFSLAPRRGESEELRQIMNFLDTNTLRQIWPGVYLRQLVCSSIWFYIWVRWRGYQWCRWFWWLGWRPSHHLHNQGSYILNSSSWSSQFPLQWETTMSPARAIWTTPPYPRA